MNIINLSSSLILTMLRRKEKEDSPGHSYSHILRGISTALAGKGIALATSFVAVPLTVRYLGAERYGVWVTLTSVLGWLTIFDLGIGNTAINSVAEALAHEDFQTARLRINTAYLTLAAVAAVLGLGLAAAWHWISWPLVLGAQVGTNSDEITQSAAILCFVVLANFPLAVTSRILGACKKVTLANYWSSAASLLSLLLLVIATRLHAGLAGLVLAFSGSTLLVGTLSAAWLYHHFEWLKPTFRGIRRKNISELLSGGVPFFAVQISGLILFQTDNIIIAQILGAGAVTPYSVTWKLFSYASLISTISIPSLWPAYADAFARRDFGWIRKTYWYNIRVVVGLTLVVVAILMFIGRRFIALWAGSAAEPSIGLVVAMAAWTVLVAPLWCQSCLLGAAGRVKGQAIYSATGAVVNVGVSIWAGRVFGLTGVIMGTLCAYAVCILIPQTLDVQRLLSNK